MAGTDKTEHKGEELTNVGPASCLVPPLSESENAFITLANFVPQFVWMCTPDGMNIYFNQRWVDYTGLTLEESYGRGWNTPFHPDDKQAAWDAWNHAVETGEQYYVESRLRAADGSYRWFLMRGASMRHTPGGVARWFGTCTDIEDLKRESEGRFRSVLDNSRDVIYRFNLQTGRYEYISPSAETITGYTPDELMALDHEASLAMVHPDDLAAMRASLERSNDTGAGESEYRQRTKGGEYRWLSNRISLIKDNAGRPHYRDGNIRDITERKKAEEAVSSSRERMAAIIGSALDAVITIGVDQQILAFNAAAEKIFGCPEAEAIGRSLERFIPMVFREAHRRHVEAFAGSGTTSRSMNSPGILSGLRASGEEFPLEATISQVTVSGERLFTVILRDLTQRIQTEQALIRSEKLASVGRMAATISHEINNPLAAVTNLLFLVKGIDDLPESARQLLEMADAEVNRIAHITRQSLGFYREFSAPAPTSVNGVLESAIDLLKNKIKTKQAAIKKQWSEVIEITAIAGELRQVFANLLGNSLDAIGENGVIALRVSTCTALKNGRRCVRVTMADSGSGIGRKAQQHIFEPFFTTKGAVGTGLGLWISKQIVDKHGGTIRLRSSTEEMHRGTVFSITLPLEPVVHSQTAVTT
jgi:PAS domain S-box-containing protein